MSPFHSSLFENWCSYWTVLLSANLLSQFFHSQNGPKCKLSLLPREELGKDSRGNPRLTRSIVLCRSPVSPGPERSPVPLRLALSPQCIGEKSPGFDLERDTFPLWVAVHHANYRGKLGDERNGWRYKPRRKICP